MHKVFKAGASLIATTALAASAFVGTAAPAQAAPSGSLKCQLNLNYYGVVKAGTKGRSALAAECSLANAGFRVTKNGNFSAADVDALVRFKARDKLSGGKVVDKATWAALLSHGPRPSLVAGSRGGAVLRVQRALVATGRSVAFTGKLDKATRNRIKGIQRAEGWRQTGNVKAGEWRLLQSGRVAAIRVLGPSVSSSSSSKGAIALAFAKKQLGDRYRYGAAGPNAWDCSGLTMKAWAKAGKKLPHSARGQFHKGRAVSKKNLKPGDLVFFYSGISHVAIYAGNGKVIHASRPGKPVAYIKMKYMPYKGARRIG